MGEGVTPPAPRLKKLWRTYSNFIIVRNPPLYVDSNPRAMYGENPPDIVTPVYKLFGRFIVSVCYEPP